MAKLCNNYILICGLNFPSWLFLKTNAFRRRLKHNVRIKQNKCKLCFWETLATVACTGVPVKELRHPWGTGQAVSFGSGPGSLNTAQDTWVWEGFVSESMNL